MDMPSASFPEKKERFFNELPTLNKATALHEIKQKAFQENHSFLAPHLFSIEEEFRHLFAVLERDETESKDFWLYCYYCCLMLAHYYEEDQYNNSVKSKEYYAIAEQIEQLYQNGVFPAAQLTWQAQLKADLNDLLTTPYHLSKIRNWLGFANIYRIAFTFSRLTTQEFYLTINKWFTLLSQTLHVPLDLDEMNRKINGPTATFRALSVGLFASRLLINLGLVIKHTFFPTKGEEQLDISFRFYQEIKNRYPQMLNDIVWATINGLTNYAEFFHIPGPVASKLLIPFLIFDASLLTYRLWEAEGNYLLKRAEYIREKKMLLTELTQLLQSKVTNLQQIQFLLKRLQLLDKQMEEQEIRMKIMKSNFGANIVAASLIALGFSVSLLVALPAAITTCYLTIVIGTALYISADAYSHYQDKRIRQERLFLRGENTDTAKKETQAAWNSFIGTMVKNIAMPILIMGTLAVCWQAAVALLALFVAYEYANKYMKTNADYKKNQSNTLFKEPPAKSELVNTDKATAQPSPTPA